MPSNSTNQIFHEIVETIREPLLVLDSNLKVLFASQNFMDTFQVTREETLGNFVYDLGNQQWNIPKLRELLNTILSQHTAFNNYEVQHDFSIIGRRTMLLNARQVQREVDNDPIILLAIEDITERNRLKDLLKESEERFRRLFETANDGILLLEKQEMKIQYANPAITAMLGYSNAELIDKEMEDIGFPHNLGRIQELMQTLKSDGIMHYKDAPVKKKTGQIVDADIYLVDKTNLIQCNVRDITERKLAEETLRKSHQIIEGILDTMPVRVFWKDQNLIYLGCNKLFARDAGFDDPKDIIGKDDYQMVWRDQAELYRNDDLGVIESGEAKYLIEEPQTIHEGNTITLLTSKTPLRSAAGEINGILGTYIDITERKRAEKEKEHLEGALRQALKMEAVGRLAGGVAHDFNNMLSVIIGHAEMAMEGVDPAQPLYADLEEIKKAGERSADLTQQLLAFARKQTVAPKVLDLNKTVGGMTRMLQRLIGEDIDLSLLPDEKLWPVKMDPSQIDQILANLCVNARDAITDVGKITIETGNVVFDETYCNDHVGFLPGEYVLLAVSDNGCGMDPETIGNIFEPFFTTKESAKGTGLGLSTVYGAVKQNNGFINVYSEPGQGTTFKIYLPRHLTKTAHLSEKMVNPSPGRGQETILLVEDESAILRMTTMMLERLGYTVVAARTPGEAISLAHEYTGKIDLLITDVVMPEMNGRDLAKNILSFYPNLKRLFMSGYTASVIAHHGVLDEGVNFIQKPFSRGNIGAKIREVLDKDKD